MTPKATDQAPARSSTATAVVNPGRRERKPWKKRTPVEVMLDQINRIKDDVAEKEEELKQAKRQLQKLEEARKVLESV